MSSGLIVAVIIGYFALLYSVARFTAKGAGNEAFFTGERKSPWFVVAFGMIGASLSGVTFISVPGWVAESQFSYMQMVLGYVPGYIVIAFVLLPLYYRLRLTSIYQYLGDRFGRKSYLTGAWFFLLSRTLGAAARLYLVAFVLQKILFDDLGVPFIVTVVIAILCIWIYTNKGGIKTIIWTDTFQTLFMLVAVVTTVLVIGHDLGWSIGELVKQVQTSEYARVFFFEDPKETTYFWKKFLAGAFIAIAMTGLDQDMMQKNLTCKNIGDAQKNVITLSIVLLGVNLIFLGLGAVLYLYANLKGLPIPQIGDELFASLATEGNLPIVVGVLFLLGLIAAAYSSADSALTSLTTSVCVDVFGIEANTEKKNRALIKKANGISIMVLGIAALFYWSTNNELLQNSNNNSGLIFTLALFLLALYGIERVRRFWELIGKRTLGFIGKGEPDTAVALRKSVHLLVSIVLLFVILIYQAFNNKSVIDLVFTLAGYTYGPLLGMFAFGILTNWTVKDRWVPVIALVAPVLTFMLNSYSEQLFNGYKFGFELLLVNASITFIGMLIAQGNHLKESSS